MEKITNFDNFEFRSHYMGELMSPVKGKTNLQKYEDAVSSLKEKELKYSETKNKETKTAIELECTIKRIKSQDLIYLEAIKDIPVFSEACKTRLAQIYTEATTGRTKNIQSKYMEKGLHMEEDAITMYSKWKLEYYRKNQVQAHNGFIKGTMDFEEDEDTSVDAKTSWDVFTFDRNAVKKIERNYEWQGQCYMWLFNKKVHKVVYALLNTPEFLIDGQLKKIEYELPKDQWEAAKEEVMHLNIYNDLPLERRLRIFTIKRDDTKIDMIKASVPNWRYFLNNYKTINMNSDDTD